MKVTVDANRCELHGECMVAAPQVFDIEDDADAVTVLDPEPPAELRAAVKEAEMMCPMAAIRVEG